MRLTTAVIIWNLSVAYVIAASNIALATPRGVSDQASTRLSGYAQLNHISPPSSGVKLLEDILEKVRSIPQIAMAKGLRQQAQETSIRQGPTDYRLAIKPKDVSLAQQAAIQGASSIGSGKAYYGSPEPAKLVPGQKGIWEWASQGELTETESRRKTVWENDSQQIASGMSVESQERLSNAVGKLYGLAKKLEESNKLVAQAPAPLARARVNTASAGGAGLVGALPPTSFAPETSDERELKAKGIQEYLQSAPSLLDTSATALLPPNVVTGIPIVKLGSSETQANRALAAIGNMSRERIGSWTVWSYHKPNLQHTALQVYMRHGQVAALRIFDSSFANPDLGVRLGDDLSVIKGRFGEPAFILGEPGPGLGQNYVYPISQVAFLMARPSPDANPEVISLLIFNIK